MLKGKSRRSKARPAPLHVQRGGIIRVREYVVLYRNVETVVTRSRQTIWPVE